MNNYYKEFSEIRQDMSAEEIRQELNRQNAVLGSRFDAKSLETQEVIKAALEVFRDEESKRAYDQALAGSAPPKADPAQERRTKQAELLQRAQDFYDKEEYDLAKTAMDRALEQDKDLPTNKEYHLAARIYCMTDEYGRAFQYINEALLLKPEYVRHIMLKGFIYGRKARKLAKNSRISSSPELQAEYQELRAKELAHFRNAYEQARSEIDRISALEFLAKAEYSRANLIDEEQAEKDRKAGIQHLREAEKLGPLDSGSQKILKEFEARCERRKQNAELVKTLMKSANDYLEERKYDQARADIEDALKLDVEPNSLLYGMAADIYCWCGDCDAASLYIGKALALEPEHPFLIAVKGQLCGIKAWKLAEDSRFSSASHLRSKYQALRKQELALLNDALKDVRKWADILKSEDRLEDGLSAALFPDDERDEEGLLYIMVLERLAWAEYFRPDQIDPAQAKAEQCSGLEHVLSSYTGSFWSAAINAIVRDYNDLSAQARIFYATGEYAQARVWIEKALHLGEAGIHVTSALYKDAAQIYLKNHDIDSALWYIDRERNRDPKNIDHLCSTGEFCGREALALSKNSQFGSSPALQEMYQKVRAKELEVYQEACKVAHLNKDPREIAYALGQLAWAEHFRPNQIDTAQAERERRTGVEHASEAERMRRGHSKQAAEILIRHKERMELWTKQARSHYDKKEYVQAKNVIEKALAEKGDTGGQYLYWLAAVIYMENNELDAALEYIDIALEKAPKDVYNITVKGEIYGRKAISISKSSNFKTSLERQKKYHTFLAEELALMEKAVAVARESGNKEEQAYTLGYLAWVVYFRYDITKEDEKSLNHRKRGCELARRALELGKSWRAQKVLDAEEKF